MPVQCLSVAVATTPATELSRQCDITFLFKGGPHCTRQSLPPIPCRLAHACAHRTVIPVATQMSLPLFVSPCLDLPEEKKRPADPQEPTPLFQSLICVSSSCQFCVVRCSHPAGPSMHWFKYFIPADAAMLRGQCVDRATGQTLQDIIRSFGYEGQSCIGAFTVVPFSLAMKTVAGHWSTLYWFPSWNAQVSAVGIPATRHLVRFLLDIDGVAADHTVDGDGPSSPTGLLNAQRASAFAT